MGGTLARPGRAWSLHDLIRLYTVNAVALVVVVTAWWAAAGTVRTTTQIACIAAGIAAVILAGGANCVWLLVGRRAVALRRRTVRAKSALVAELLTAQDDVAPADPLRATDLLYLPGSRRYHRPGCELLAGKSGVKRAGAADRTSRLPCGVCAP
jgi:hypothetical protein